jgi:hypothetical protein
MTHKAVTKAYSIKFSATLSETLVLVKAPNFIVTGLKRGWQIVALTPGIKI